MLPTDLGLVASLVDASLTLFSKGDTIGEGADLLSSLPISTYGRAMRSRITETLLKFDVDGTAAVQSEVRSALAYLPCTDLGKVCDVNLLE